MIRLTSKLYGKPSAAGLLLFTLFLTCSLPVLSADYTLTVTTAGAGIGTVNSTPLGISCESGIPTGCSAAFNDVDPVTLMASSDWKSLFAGWAGPCSGTGDCVLTLTADTEVTATFSPNYQAKVLGMGMPEYATLTDAYANADYDDIVAAHVYTFLEDLVLNRAIFVKLYGGKGDLYLSTVGFTTLSGTLEVQVGSAEVDALIIQ